MKVIKTWLDRNIGVRLPEGNDGLGLMLLGITGDQILEPPDLQRTKSQSTFFCSGNGSGGYFKRRSGTKHLHFFYRVFAQVNG